MKPPPRLACDVMLGRLARWLRILGADTLYRRDWRDAELVGVAHREGRLLVTRDVQLTQRRGAPASLLVRANDLFGQLLEVCRALEIQPGPDCFTRCSVCNAEIRERPAAALRDRLFPYVRDTQTRVAYCPRCDRIYWEGTHPQRIEATLSRLSAVLAGAPPSAPAPTPGEEDDEEHE